MSGCGLAPLPLRYVPSWTYTQIGSPVHSPNGIVMAMLLMVAPAGISSTLLSPQSLTGGHMPSTAGAHVMKEMDPSCNR